MQFNTKDDFILENKHVLLRPLVAEDENYLLKFSLEEPEIWTYSLISGAGNEALKTYLQSAILARQAGIEYAFIVWDKTTNQYAGSTRFYDIQVRNKTLQLGYTWYGKQFQGTAINKSCKYLLLEFAFEKLAVERVEFRADFRNKRSIAAMKSIGCIEEGVLRSNCADSNDGRRDSIILSILKSEWQETVKALLAQKLNEF